MSPAEYIALALLGEAALAYPDATPALARAADEIWQTVIDTPAPRGWVEREHRGCYRLWGETW